ncbi:hypothetical protein [Kribbella sp. NPDC051620]|uniref:hypothetical protein n=1 Tax=Kribbella sp. NPDC051620 TaxID=3364120 RepID=UPI0037AB0F75
MDRLGDEVRKRLECVWGMPTSRRALRELGLSDNDLRRLVRNDHLHHERKHYLDAGIDPVLARIAGAQAAYPESVISHFSAAALADLRTWTDRARPHRPPTAAVWLTRHPSAKRNQRRDDVVLRRAGLPLGHLTRQNGFLTTSNARTVVDLARELPAREAVVSIDHALRTGTPIEAIQAVLDRQYRWPGIRRARDAVALADPGSESALESIARLAFIRGGLPAPNLQAQFWDGWKWMLERVDFWWPEHRTVAEADGLAKYEADTAVERRRRLRDSYERDQRLSDLDVEVVRFGWEDVVGDSSRLLHRLRQAFIRGGRRTGPSPTWRSALVLPPSTAA